MGEHEILLVDDDPQLLDVVGQALDHNGYIVTKEASGEGAIEALGAKNFDLIIIDLNIGETDGIAVLKRAKKLNPETMVILLICPHVNTLSAGADGYVNMPCGLAHLCQRVASCLEEL